MKNYSVWDSSIISPLIVSIMSNEIQPDIGRSVYIIL